MTYINSGFNITFSYKTFHQLLSVDKFRSKKIKMLWSYDVSQFFIIISIYWYDFSLFNYFTNKRIMFQQQHLYSTNWYPFKDVVSIVTYSYNPSLDFEDQFSIVEFISHCWMPTRHRKDTLWDLPREMCARSPGGSKGGSRFKKLCDLRSPIG